MYGQAECNRRIGGDGNDLLRVGLGDDRAHGKDPFIIDGGVSDLRGGAERDVFRFAEDGFLRSADLTEIRRGTATTLDLNTPLDV